MRSLELWTSSLEDFLSLYCSLFIYVYVCIFRYVKCGNNRREKGLCFCLYILYTKIIYIYIDEILAKYYLRRSLYLLDKKYIYIQLQDFIKNGGTLECFQFRTTAVHNLAYKTIRCKNNGYNFCLLLMYIFTMSYMNKY